MAIRSRYVPALRFDSLTPLYDAVVRTTTRERRFKRALIAQANGQAGHTVLDLATGTGTLAIWMKSECAAADVTALDGDPKILEIAKRKARAAGIDITWVQGYSTDLPFPDQRFDRVLSSLFFHHLVWDDKVATAREIHRVLKPGGEVHVADWGRPSNRIMRGLFFAIQLLDGFENTRDHVDGRLEALFKDAGFGGVRATQSFDTVYGTLVLYRAHRTGQP